MTTINEQLQQVKTYFETRNSGMLIQVLDQASGPSSQKVQDELEIQIENLKNEAIKQFDQERYSECLRSFQFLCELDSQNRQFNDYLELCKQILGEKETSPNKTILVNAYKNFDEIDLEFKESTKGDTKAPKPDGVIYDSPSSAGSSPPGKSIVGSKALSRVNTAAICEEPGKAIRPLKRVLRVSALVTGMMLLIALLSHWTYLVRAPHLPDATPKVLSQTQLPEPEKQEIGAKNAGTQITPSDDRQKKSSESTQQKTPGSGDSTREDSEWTEVYPVVHEHRFGSCRGQLKLSRNYITFLSFEDSGDSFKHSPKEIIELEFDRTLKIKFAERTYRFTSNSARSKQDNRSKLKRIYQQLIKLRRETP